MHLKDSICSLYIYIYIYIYIYRYRTVMQPCRQWLISSEMLLFHYTTAWNIFNRPQDTASDWEIDLFWCTKDANLVLLSIIIAWFFHHWILHENITVCLNGRLHRTLNEGKVKGCIHTVRYLNKKQQSVDNVHPTKTQVCVSQIVGELWMGCN